MLPTAARTLWKQALGKSRVKVVYARITLTRLTTLYFFFALLNCVVLVILQGVTYADNTKAVGLIGGILSEANMKRGLPIFSDGELQMCDSIPGQPGALCTTVTTSKIKRELSTHELRETHTQVSKRVVDKEFNFKTLPATDGEEEEGSDSESESESDDDDDDDDDEKPTKQTADPPVITESTLQEDNSSTVPVGNSTGSPPGRNHGSQGPKTGAATDNDILDVPCAYTMLWLDDVLQDAKREDLVTLSFQFWLFSLSVVTVLNESLPHLGASLAGHVLGTAWAAYRVQWTYKMRARYMSIISTGVCKGVDMLEGWWDSSKSHAIPILAISALTLLVTAFLSFKLFKVYASQSFSRVGASPQIHRMYTLVLFLSASLQLAGFFSLASTAMWIDKISHGVLQSVAVHSKFYLAAFIVTLLLALPWLVLGWVSVRREYRKLFLVFFAISIVLVAISTLMFTSTLYRFIFMSWPFFATITVTAYIFVVATSLLALWCRLHFGKGLSHFLQVSEALEGADFTPVYFNKAKDTEKGNVEFPVRFEDGNKNSNLDEKLSSDPEDDYLQQPKQTHRTIRGHSVYSESNGLPVMMSSTPSLFRDRSVAAVQAGNTHRNRAFRGDHLDMDGESTYAQPRMPPASAATRSRTRSRDLTSSPTSAGRHSPPTPSLTPRSTPSKKTLPASPKRHSDA